jgi:sporulation protein YunB
MGWHMKTKTKVKLLVIVFIIMAVFNIFLYTFDKIVTPTVMVVADAEMRAKAIEIINTCSIEQYSKDFNYDSIIKVEKDRDGNITMLKADTLQLNKIASQVALESQKRIRELGNVGIKLPIGYILKNNILAYLGPSITIKMQPIGHIETKYSSDFESVGINQTRHKIYVQVRTEVRVILPLRSNNIEVRNEIPISETIIIGKVPDTSINLDLQSAGFKLPNK